MYCHSINSDIMKNHQCVCDSRLGPRSLCSPLCLRPQSEPAVSCCLHTRRNDFCHWVGTSIREGKFQVSFSRSGVVLTLKGKRFQVAFPCPVFSALGLYPATIIFHINRGRVSTLPCLSPRFIYLALDKSHCLRLDTNPAGRAFREHP